MRPQLTDDEDHNPEVIGDLGQRARDALERYGPPQRDKESDDAETA